MSQYSTDGCFDARWSPNSDDKLFLPLRWRKPRRIFVNSMSDLFHESVPFEFVDKAFAVMALCQKHTFQILTKRPERMAEYLSKDPYPNTSRIGAIQHHLDVHYARTTPKEMFGRSGTRNVLSGNWPLPNVWMGTSVESQPTADERIPHLLRCPASVRFLSCEPLLGAVDLSRRSHQMSTHHLVSNKVCALTGKGNFMRYPAGMAELSHNNKVDWVICGGESGPNARPMHPDWARSLRDQCQSAGVPFFFKQGSQTPEWPRFKDFDSFPEDLRIREFPKETP